MQALTPGRSITGLVAALLSAPGLKLWVLGLDSNFGALGKDSNFGFGGLGFNVICWPDYYARHQPVAADT